MKAYRLYFLFAIGLMTSNVSAKLTEEQLRIVNSFTLFNNDLEPHPTEMYNGAKSWPFGALLIFEGDNVSVLSASHTDGLVVTANHALKPGATYVAIYFDKAGVQRNAELKVTYSDSKTDLALLTAENKLDDWHATPQEVRAVRQVDGPVAVRYYVVNRVTRGGPFSKQIDGAVLTLSRGTVSTEFPADFESGHESRLYGTIPVSPSNRSIGQGASGSLVVTDSGTALVGIVRGGRNGSWGFSGGEKK